MIFQYFSKASLYLFIYNLFKYNGDAWWKWYSILHILGGPFSLIRYEAEIEISENIEEYKKAKNSQKVLDPKPSPEGIL